VFDHHGMTEVGPVTYECPAQPGVLHVIESAFLPEIVDPQTGEPVPAGEKGELILTTLVRTGSPLLRYRTGDLVCAAKDAVCKCGRHDLALAGGIIGRVDDMVVVRGVNVYPSAVEETLRRFPEIAEYQVVLTTANSLNELNVKIEPAEHCADVDSLLRRVENAFQTNFSLRVPVVAVNTGSLPRFEMKAKRWIKY
jgi:phenylacetate-CoA ligase